MDMLRTTVQHCTALGREKGTCDFAVIASKNHKVFVLKRP